MIYSKVTTLEYAQNELIGKKIADIYEILCPKYFIRVIDGSDAEAFSYDLNELGCFTDSVIFDIDGTNLYDIYNRLDIRNFDTERIMPDVFKMYIMDMLFSNSDRSPSNWGILKSGENQRLAIFDNELLFSNNFAPFIFADTEDLRGYAKEDGDDIFEARLKDLRMFLFTYDNKYIQLFKDLLYRIPPEKLESIFDEVEIESGTKIVSRETKLKQYRDTFTSACNLLEELDMAVGRK